MQPQFIFGGNTGVSDPMELKRRREIVDALIAGNLNRTPQTFGEGLAAIGQAIAGRIQDKKLSAQEAKARENAQGQFSAITGALMGGQPQQQPQAAPGPNQGLADDAMAAIGKAPQRIGADAVVQGLVQRGLSPAQAQGVAMNFADESGFNTGAVGDNGNAIGLAQWNGPRKAALEQYAIARGAPVTDPNVQLDYLMQELQGPEKRAGQMLAQAQTPGEAAAAFLNHFERPAEQHRAAREARYLGVARPDVGQMAQLADNPYLGESQRAVISQMLAQRMQPQEAPKPIAVGGSLVDPTTGRVIYQSPQEAPRPVAVGGRLVDPSTGQVIYEPPKDQVSDEYGKRQAAAEAFGLKPDDPAYQSFVLTGKMPREDQAPLTVTDKKAIIEADDLVQANTATIDMLQSVLTPGENGKSLNEMAGSGALAGAQSWFARNDPTGLFDDQQGQATTELQNVVLNQALGQLKATFGAAPTEGERKILIDIQASVDKTPAEREIVIRRAIELARKRLEFNRQRAAELRGGTYYKPQEAAQPQPQQSAPVATHRFNPQTGQIEAIQ